MQFAKTGISLLPFLLITFFCNNATDEDKNALPDSPGITNVGSKRALLIGINDYPFVSPKLFGCINDVSMMRSLLIRKYNFPPGQITTLLNEKATRAGMLKAFHDLIAATKPHDTVVIHYSGHGSQISDPAETDGVDETIIPYDYRDSPHGALPITDKQISNMLGELSQKTTNITVILDCCHSGGATKDLLTGTEKEIRADSRKAPSEGDFLPPGGRSISENMLKNAAAKYVLLAGCRSDQKSYETKSANGIYGGMLTLSLVNKLSVATERQTWPAIVEDLQTHIRQFYNQSPELVGLNKNSYVFGATYTADETYFTVQPGTNMVIVDGGRAHDITVGSTYKVYPPGTLNFNTASIGMLQIVKVLDFTAEAKIINGKVPALNCRAIEYKHVVNKDQKTFVCFLGSWKGAAASIKKKILAVSSIEENTRYPNIIYYQKGNEVITYSGRDTIHVLETFPLDEANSADALVSSAVRWNKWFRVANIKNPGSKLKVTLTFENAKDINIDKADFNFKSGVTMSFNIKNNSSIPVYVYILDLADNGDIDVYTLDAFKTPGQTNSEAIPVGSSVSCSLTPRVRPGHSLTRDILKIFVTSTPTDFKSFQQDHSKFIGEDDAAKSLDPPNKPLENATDWSTLEKVIFVTK
jgi:hypothetical protein